MDLENERRPIKPLKSGKTASRANELTGMTNILYEFIQEYVMYRPSESANGWFLPRYCYGEGYE
jgi:hypothetical protein